MTDVLSLLTLHTIAAIPLCVGVVSTAAIRCRMAERAYFPDGQAS